MELAFIPHDLAECRVEYGCKGVQPGRWAVGARVAIFRNQEPTLARRNAIALELVRCL